MAKTAEKSASKAKAKPKTGGAKVVAKDKGPKPAEQPRQPGVERRRNHPTRAKNGTFQLLLTQAVPHLGQPGELVKVRPGFARNYLLPHGLATFATPHNLRIVEKHRKRLRALEEARRTDLLNLSKEIAQRRVLIDANANAEGQLYGSVNADQIAAALRTDGFPIDASHVKIEGPLKYLGQYSIRVHLGFDINTEVELWIVPTTIEDATA